MVCGKIGKIELIIFLCDKFLFNIHNLIVCNKIKNFNLIQFKFPKKKLLGGGNSNEVVAWLDLVLRVTGAERQLTQLMTELEPRIHEVEQRVYPAVQRLESVGRRWRAKFFLK
jgi:hypothetical protein